MSFSSFFYSKETTFKQPAGTSRGILHDRLIFYIVFVDNKDPNHWGIGECAPLPGLSLEFQNYKELVIVLEQASKTVCKTGTVTEELYEKLRAYPSVLFAIETALRHYEQKSVTLWDTPFTRGEIGIPINGLVWMGNIKQMQERAEEKLMAGFRCIKFKIGALDFQKEVEMIAGIRAIYTPDILEIRLDANGAFSPDDALEKLQILSQFQIHSIEQPIKAGQWEALADLCSRSPIPIALDEELINNYDLGHKKELLDTVKPQYIVLKPSLHGGFRGCEEWIQLAQERHIGYWITSALETNIGLNAIAQWCSTFTPSIPQGLGTGALYTENYELPIEIRGNRLWYRPGRMADFLQERLQFEIQWDIALPTITLQTSGSTGRPKLMKARKISMMKSALNTCLALNLHPDETALLAMPVKYIAGMMMVVRARMAKLQLISVPPSSRPLADMPDSRHIHFAALTPMQVHCTLNGTPAEIQRLKEIDHLIIGGGFISEQLEKELQCFPNEVWSTYGMTETLSHIALRRISGSEHSNWYTPVPGIKIGLERGVLTIEAKDLFEGILITNDMAEINASGEFRILGRKDNVINSGGIKIQIETAEAYLEQYINGPYAITSIPDEKYGESAVLLVTPQEQNAPNQLLEICRSVLPRYWAPQQVIQVDQIPQTQTGKTDRSRTKQLALESLNISH